MKYVGFPELFLKNNQRFYNKWKKLRKELLFNEDIRTFTNIQEIELVKILADLLTHQATHLLKSITWWNDNGFGEFSLYYLRTIC